VTRGQEASIEGIQGSEKGKEGKAGRVWGDIGIATMSMSPWLAGERERGRRKGRKAHTRLYPKEGRKKRREGGRKEGGREGGRKEGGREGGRDRQTLSRGV
jgi:hypothetical protein